MRALAWRTLPAAGTPQGMVKGTELACAVVPDTSHRFVVYEVRVMLADRTLDVAFHVRDAGAISDADVRDGKRPPVVFRSDDCDKAVAWCLGGESA
jgi:hypothetical protein